jgi:hypothetical protein
MRQISQSIINKLAAVIHPACPGTFGNNVGYVNNLGYKHDILMYCTCNKTNLKIFFLSKIGHFNVSGFVNRRIKKRPKL